VRTKRPPPLPTDVRQHVPRSWVETDLDDLLLADAPRRAMCRAAALLEASVAREREDNGSAGLERAAEKKAAGMLQAIVRGMQQRKAQAQARHRAQKGIEAHGATALDGTEGAHVFLADGLAVGSAAGLGPGAATVRRLKRGPVFGAGQAAAKVLDALQEFLSPYRTTLDALFRHCCLTGRGAGLYEAEAMNSMGPAQVGHDTHV